MAKPPRNRKKTPLRGHPPRPARTRLDTDERRAQLLALAQATFATRSYDEVSIDDLARAAGVSKGLLYHYFPTKRDLYVAGLREAARVLMERTMIAPSAHASPSAKDEPIRRIRAGLDAYLEYASEHARAYSALLRGGIGSDPEVALVIEETRKTYVDRMIADAEGTPLPVPAEKTPLLRLALRGWVGFVEQTSLDWVVGPREVSQRELRELLVDVLLSSLKLATGAALTRDW
jgi:AcrR family transcriptional regulator